METRTGGGAPAPARIYRWEADHLYEEVSGRVLRNDDDRPQWCSIAANYFRVANTNTWLWCASDGMHGEAPTEDAARRACLLAVLHAPDPDEPGEVPA